MTVSTLIFIKTIVTRTSTHRILSKQDRNIVTGVKLHLCPKVKCGFHCVDSFDGIKQDCDKEFHSNRSTNVEIYLRHSVNTVYITLHQKRHRFRVVSRG